RSQKRTVSCRRSPDGNATSAATGVPVGGDVPSRAPQPPQNFSPGSVVAPQAPHTVTSTLPHSVQKRGPGWLVWLQDRHRIAPVLGGVSTAGGQLEAEGTRWLGAFDSAAVKLAAGLVAADGRSESRAKYLVQLTSPADVSCGHGGAGSTRADSL